MSKTEDLKKAALNNKTTLSMGMVVVGIFAAGSLAKSRRTRASGGKK
jgi:hypothetical protein